MDSMLEKVAVARPIAHIKLENLTYSYPHSDSQILSDINLELKKKGNLCSLWVPAGVEKVLLSAALTG